MSETKHTKGPWEWQRVDETGAVTEWTLEGPDVLCRFWHDKPPSHDARLIAAAPELLALVSELAKAHAGGGFIELDADLANQLAAAAKAEDKM